MPSDLSSVARKAAGREAERHWPTGREYSTAQTSAVFSVKEIDAYCASALVRGFTECASRLPSEREVAEAARAGSAEYLREDIPEDGLSEDQHIARAVYALIGEKISGGAEASR